MWGYVGKDKAVDGVGHVVHRVNGTGIKASKMARASHEMGIPSRSSRITTAGPRTVIPWWARQLVEDGTVLRMNGARSEVTIMDEAPKELDCGTTLVLIHPDLLSSLALWQQMLMATSASGDKDGAVHLGL